MKKKNFLDMESVKAVLIKGKIGENLDKMALSKAVQAVIHFVVGILFAMVQGPLGTYPFGVALVCASQGAANSALSMSGALIGALAMSSGSLWQMIIVMLVFLVRTVQSFASCGANNIITKGFKESLYLRITVSAAAAMGAGVVGIFSTDGVYFGIASALCGVFLYTSFTALFLFFQSSTVNPSQKLLGVGALCYVFVLLGQGLPLPFNLGISITFFLSVWFTYAGGVGYGVAVSVCCALAIGDKTALLFPLLALVYGMLMSKFASVGLGISTVCATFWGLSAGGLEFLTDSFPEICLGAAVCVPLIRLGILPATLPPFLKCEKLDGWEGVTALQLDRNSVRYKAVSDSLESLSKMLYSVCDKLKCPVEQDAYRMCIATRARYCQGCRHEGVCTGECKAEVDSMFENMAYRLSASGRVSAKIVPEEIARRCYNIDSIIDMVNTSAKRAAGISSCGATTELFAQDYSAMASLLREVSDHNGDWKRDGEAEKALSRALSDEGFNFAAASVYGERAKHIFMRGISMENMTAGESDVRKCAQKLLNCRLSPVEFSIDKGYISASMHTVSRYSIKSGRYSTAGLRDETSGDSVCSFKNHEGYYYTLVSDGMGSGRDAAIISGVSSMFLEKLLSAGCPMKSALEMLNCFVRGSEGEQFTTVDLMEADLYTGKARFVKSGAAPSFVLRGGQLYRLHSKTVPVGIMRALDAESISFDVAAGDMIIMMSDGVTGSYEECPWLYELLSGGLNTDAAPAALARIIGQAAEQNMGRDDDITVCVMKVSEIK